MLRVLRKLRSLLLLGCIVFLAGCSDSADPSAQQTDSVKSSSSKTVDSGSLQKQVIDHTATVQNLSPQARDQIQQDYASTPFKVLRIAEQTWDDGPALAITLSVPLDPKSSFRSYLSVTDDKRQPVVGDWILSESLNVVYFPFIQPETQYQVHVNQSLTAINGRLLQSDEQRTITTRRAEQSLRFISQGAQLSPVLSEGLSIEAVNTAALDIDFHRVDDAKLKDFFQHSLGNDYYDLRRLKTFADLVYSARYDLDFEPNKRRKAVLPITQHEALQDAGVYIAVMKGAGEYPYSYQVTWFTISDLGFQLRQFADEWVVFAHRVESARPANAVSIELYNAEGRLISESHTDPQGFTRISKQNASSHQAAVLALARQGKQLSLLRLNKPAMDLTEFGLVSRSQRPLELFLYAPRDLYRPGESVNINGLLRDNDARLLQAQDIAVTIKKPDGRVHQTLVWRGDEQSFYQHTFTIPKQTETGEWMFEAQLGNGDVFHYPVKVEDFLPERMKLTLTSGSGTSDDPRTIMHRSAKEHWSIDVQGDYLYGAPASGNRYETQLEVKQARTLFDQWKEFVFGAENYTDFDQQIDLPVGQLDDQGGAKINIVSDWANAEQPLRVTTRISLFESGGRPVTRKLSQIVWPSDTLIGVRPTWQGQVANPNGVAQIEMIHVDQLGQLKASADLDVTLIREDARYYWEWDDGWNYHQNDHNVPVYNRRVSIDDNQRLTLNLPVEYGFYRLEVRAADQRLLNSYQFFAGWRWDRPESGATGRPDQVKLAWQQSSLRGDETATLNIESPYTGTAVVTVESQSLLWQGQVKLEDTKGSIEIPVSADWNRHDIYVTANVIHSGDAKRKHLPKRAFGLLHLPLDRENRRLEMTLDVADKHLPESTMTTRIKIDGAAGQPVFVTLAAVDTGVLSLSGFKTPKPHDWFFAKRQFTTELHDTWGALIEQLSDRRARQRFGGDSDELSRGGDAPQSEVQVVSLFSGKVAVNDQGFAEIPLQLPYFNGELRLMALAWSDAQFGHQEAKVKVAAPLIAEISTPRFMALGDQSTATFDIQNLTDSERTFSLLAEADDALGKSRIETVLTLAPKQKSIAQLPLNALATEGQGVISLTVNQTEPSNSPDKISLRREWKLGLRAPYPAELRQHDAIISPQQAISLPTALTDDLLVNAQHLVLTVSSQPPFSAAEQLQHLLQYPYGCLEQTSSRAWPLLLASEAELIKYDDSVDKQLAKNRTTLIQDAISRILGMQRSDGSFGLWSNQSAENHWLTVFASEFLLSANDLGYAVDSAALSRALKRLNDYLTTRGKMWSENNHYSQWPDHYHFAYRAYAALVLAKRQQAPLGDLRNLYDQFGQFSKTRLPMAQMALALELGGDTRRSEQAWKSAMSMSPHPQGYSGDYGSAIRDLAWTSVLAMQSKLVQEPWGLLFTLRDELISRRWISTQERFALYRLSNALDKIPGSEWVMALESDDKPQSVSATGQWIRHWVENAIPEKVRLTNLNEKPLFVRARAQGYPATTPKPQTNGIQVQRYFMNQSGGAVDLKQVKTGDLILVRVDLRSVDEQQIPDALLIEFLPAGLELENQNLLTSVKIDDIKVGEKTVAEWMQNANLVHQEYRDDRYVAALPLHRYGAVSVFYLARAVTPGIYKVPPTQVEDMYRPYLRAVSDAPEVLVIQAK